MPLAVLVAMLAALMPRSAAAECIALEQTSIGTFYLAATAGRAVTVDFLLDTGSAYVVVAPATLGRLRHEGSVSAAGELVALLADGRRVNAPILRLERLRLSPSCLLSEVDVVALPGARRNIIGWSALRQVAPFTVHLSPARLALTCAGEADAAQCATLAHDAGVSVPP